MSVDSMNRRYDIFVVVLIVVAFSGYGIYTAGIGPFDDDPGVTSITVTDRGCRGDLPQVYGSYEGAGDNKTYTGVINTASPAATLSANLSQISRNNTRFKSYAINIKTHNESGGNRSCQGEVAYRIVSTIPEGSVGSRVATLYNGYLAGCDVSITGNASANVGCYQYFGNHGLADNRSVGSPASF